MHMSDDGAAPNGGGPTGGGWGVLIRWGPRLLFLAAAIVLTTQSARGAPRSELNWALGFFAACSLLLAWRQLARGNDPDAAGSPARLLIGAGAVLCAGGATMLILSRTGVEADTLPLVGSVVLVLGLGCFVELWRQQDDRALLLPGALLLGIVGIVLVVVLLVLRGGGNGLSTGLLVALGVAVLVCLPLGLNALSEWGLRALSGHWAEEGRRGPLVLSGGLAGAVVVAGATGFAVWLASHDWVLTAILVGSVLVLLVAIVSNTHADVALVLAGLCLIAAAPPEQPAPPPGGNRVLVAVGDSYMSGEGAGTYIENTNDAGGDHCRRAPSAYAVKIAAQDSRFDGLRFVACSGARTFHVIADADDRRAHPQRGVPDTQIDQLKKMGSSLHPALVIVSIGGNDAGFSTVGEACIAPGPCETQKSLFEGNLDSVKDAVAATYLSLRRALPADVPIVAVPYPQPIADGVKCSGVALTTAERAFIRDFVHKLNMKVEEATREAQGIFYLKKMEDTLADHHLQLCDRKKRAAGVNFVGLKSVNGTSVQRFNPAHWLHNSLHPNERGHEAMRATFEDWLKEKPKLLEGGPATEKPDTSLPAPERGAVEKPDPQCPLAQINRSKCQLALRDWEMRQITNRWPVLLAVPLLLLVVWAAVIAGLACCRRQ